MDASGEGNAAKRAKISLPTKDEQKNLQHVESVMRTNLIQLQTSELLAQVNADKLVERKVFYDWVNQLKTDLTSGALTAVKKDISSAFLSKHKISGIKLSKHAGETTTFVFEKPAAVETIGSSSSSTGTAPLVNVDLAVTLPVSTFTQK